MDRPFYFVLKHDEKSAHVAYAVAERLNRLFRDGMGHSDIARPIDGSGRSQRSDGYRLNPERFFRVARLVPLRENPEQSLRYRQKLAQMLLDPKRHLRAALRSTPLARKPHPLPPAR